MWALAVPVIARRNSYFALKNAAKIGAVCETDCHSHFSDILTRLLLIMFEPD